jgi:cell division protein FtsZ
MYEAASDDALIIRGLSQDDTLGENISVIVIATGFEANSIFQPYKSKKPKHVEMLENKAVIPPQLNHKATGETFTVHEKRTKKSIISDFDEESQGEFDFGTGYGNTRDPEAENFDDENDKTGATLRKVKQMQKIMKKEGLSNKTIEENIETFEDVPAYVRRNMLLRSNEKIPDSKLSKFTLTSDDEDGPVLRENNAYLNDNVD